MSEVTTTRAGKYWTIMEENTLIEKCVAGLDLQTISTELQRSPLAICSRLHKSLMYRCGQHKETVETFLQGVDKSIYDYTNVEGFKRRAKAKKRRY